jgi:hypothetical protein
MTIQTQQTKKSQQTKQPGVTTRAGRPLPTRGTSVFGRNRGRIAMAIVTVAMGTALTALVIGVTDGTVTEAPPSPGHAPFVNTDMPRGIDQRLYKLAEQHAAELRELGRASKGADNRLYNLAEQHAAELRELGRASKGADNRLYNLVK